MALPCPSCRVDLVMSERAGIEIDYCPKCRGVWLDRGELDKIVERSLGPDGPARPPAAGPGASFLPSFAQKPSPPSMARRDDDDDDDRRRGHSGQPQQSTRRSWLSDIFD